ncbi:hypothetical protein [Nocardia sp. NPDC058633]|uniref:hypothetical protein n=1 Tax=Nocardia sp. NPDC058633 TaxID=3346568 RepID=UPI003653E913
MRPTEFAAIDHACAEFLRAITRIRALAVEIGDQVHWGLGESEARLISATALVSRLRDVAGARENGIAAAMDAHARIAMDIRHSFREVRDRLEGADEVWAGRLGSVESSVGQIVSSAEGSKWPTV